MEINPNEILAEMQNRYPNELTICIQAVQIRTLQTQLNQEEENETDEKQFKGTYQTIN